MRNPFPLFAVALSAAAGAFAADLPTWPVHEQPWGSWRVVNFTDSAKKGHELWCRWEECNYNKTSGTAALYVFERKGDQPYTYTEHVWAPEPASSSESIAERYYRAIKNKVVGASSLSSKTTYATKLSSFHLDMAAQPHKAVAGDQAFAVEDRAQMTPAGYILIIQPPTAVADDAPAAKKPGQGGGSRTLPVPSKPGEPAKPRKPNQPGQPTKPAAAAALSPLERDWLLPVQRTAYADATDPKKKPSSAALAKAYKDARELVAKNLRKELQDSYRRFVEAGSYDEIDKLLMNKNYSGTEVELTKDELEALKTVVKSSTTHTDWAFANGKLQYESEMRSISDPKTGHPSLKEHLLAHQITEKFRALVPVKPGTPVDPNAAPKKIPDSELGKLPKADQDAYNKAWDDAKTDDEKRALNKKYSDMIAAGGKPPSGGKTWTPEDFAKLPDDQQLAEFGKLDPTQKANLCKGFIPTSGAGAGSCADGAMGAVAGSIEECTKKYPTVKDTNLMVEVLKNRRACQENPCKNQPAKPATPAGPKPSKAIQDQCNQILQNLNPAPPTRSDIQGPEVPSPVVSTTDVQGAEPAKPEEDKNLWGNLAIGASFGIGGLILGSFFGGPLVMLGVAAVAAIGSYYVARQVDEPKPESKAPKK